MLEELLAELDIEDVEDDEDDDGAPEPTLAPMLTSTEHEHAP